MQVKLTKISYIGILLLSLVYTYFCFYSGFSIERFHYIYTDKLMISINIPRKLSFKHFNLIYTIMMLL